MLFVTPEKEKAQRCNFEDFLPALLPQGHQERSSLSPLAPLTSGTGYFP